MIYETVLTVEKLKRVGESNVNRGEANCLPSIPIQPKNNT